MTLARPRTAAVLVLAFLVTVLGFGWPFLVAADSALDGDVFAPVVVGALLPVVVAVMLAELADGGMDAKSVALLGVLAAVGVAVRAVSPATGGIEPTFVLLIVAGRVFGAGFGFAYGAVMIGTSALLTGGVGPWLPFQLLAAGWVGLVAGAVPRIPRGGRAERWWLAALTVPLALLYGAALNLSFWPLTTALAPTLSYTAGASLAPNLAHYLTFYLATSFGWDLGRATFAVVALLVAGPALLAALRRAARRGRFEPARRDAPEVGPAHGSGVRTKP